jgi:hypothetical protein
MLVLLFVNVGSSISLLVALLLIKLKVCREPDPWRRTAAVALRSEASKFVLTAFGLDIFSDEGIKHFSPAAAEKHFLTRFAKFLRTEVDAHYALNHGRSYSCRVKNQNVDVTLGRFSASGPLMSIHPLLDDRFSLLLQESLCKQVEAAIGEAYNATSDLPERIRPTMLLRSVQERLCAMVAEQAPRKQAINYSGRILRSCFVSFESIDLDLCNRFESPDFRFRRGLGLGILNIVCRLLPNGTIDLWMQIHHSGADGVPMQELLTRLENAWGISCPLAFPPDDAHGPDPRPCNNSVQERPIHLVTEFIDFTPLSILREELNQLFAARDAGNIPLGCLLVWCVSRQPEFSGVKFASVVDVPANETSQRTVGTVAIRPADYTAAPGAFATYVRDFNQLIVAARARRSKCYKDMYTIALLPPFLASKILKLNPKTIDKAFGTVCVSIIKNAKIFVASIADYGFERGFIAIGNVELPSQTGGSVASVTIKGDRERIRAFSVAIRRAIRMSRDDLLGEPLSSPRNEEPCASTSEERAKPLE